MELTIHRGSKEIGGTCIELQTAGSRILLDFGLPLVDESGQKFDQRKLKKFSKEELIEHKILPDIQGLYGGVGKPIDAVLLSHPHQDHYGLLSYINQNIPIYMSRGCKALIEASYFFGQTPCDLRNVKTISAWRPFKLRNYRITPFLVDHSGFDALGYLIEADGKRIFYSGDFRGHGRKKVVFDNLLKKPPKDVDYLILEGSMIDRDKGNYIDEKAVEEELVKLFRDRSKLFFIASSSQNIDRITSTFRACVRSGRTFVLDPYTAYILDKLKEVSSGIPQYDWGENIKVFFIPHKYTEKMAEDGSLFKFKDAKITFEEIQAMRNKIVLKDSHTMRSIFKNKKLLADSELVYSMWDGYLADVRSFWDRHKVPILNIHTSGHAYTEELIALVKAIKPKFIIPNHTFHPDRYADILNWQIMKVNDGETVKL